MRTELNKKILKDAQAFYLLMNKRRSVRHFRDKEVPLDVIQECIRAAGTAPSGANKQPWYFAVVKSKEMKKNIRIAAENEEYEFYHERNNKQWLDDLIPFKTNWEKAHLEEASALIVIFSKNFEDSNRQKRCYYPKESVGIATGILITSLHRLGISTLTHTPNPMGFLNNLLKRPKTEKPFLILAVGYQNDDYDLPLITRKTLEEISNIY